MQRIFAIAWLTWKAALRFRLFLVIAVLLILAVVGLPLVIQDDGTAQGFTQIILTYTLSAITALLGHFDALAGVRHAGARHRGMPDPGGRDEADCALADLAGQMARHRVAERGAAGDFRRVRFWTAAMARDEAAGGGTGKIARAGAGGARLGQGKRFFDAEIDAEAKQILQERLKSSPVTTADLPEVQKQIREQVKAAYQVVQPAYTRAWQIDLGFAKNYLQDKPLQLRVKFNAAQKTASGTYLALWQVGVPETAKLWQTETPMSLAADTFHEFAIPPNLFDTNGVLTIVFVNPNETALLFPLEDGMEVLYPEGGFALNFARGLGIIFCWMALLAALGLAAASFLSFPVAAFFSLAMLVVILSSGTLADAVESGTVVGGNEETGVMGHSGADAVLIPMFKGILAVTRLVENFSPIDALSTGRAITWTELGLAVGQIVLLLGGIVALAGIVLFQRRELATAQGTQ